MRSARVVTLNVNGETVAETVNKALKDLEAVGYTLDGLNFTKLSKEEVAIIYYDTNQPAK